MASKPLDAYDELIKNRPELFDYPDVPEDSGLSQAYRDSIRPQRVKDAIAKRQAYLASVRRAADGSSRRDKP